MSRIARKPLEIPKGVEFSLENGHVRVKGKNGEFKYALNDAVHVEIKDNQVLVSAKKTQDPMVGTTRKLLGNMVQGVHTGFEKKLKLFGVGYKAELKGNVLEFKMGFSHPVTYPAPKGISFELPNPAEITIKGMDKQQVGAVAAQLRDIRKPESYKGKGVQYENERLKLKEVKKK